MHIFQLITNHESWLVSVWTKLPISICEICPFCPTNCKLFLQQTLNFKFLYRRHFIFQTLKSVGSNSLSLKYQMLTSTSNRMKRYRDQKISVCCKYSISFQFISTNFTFLAASYQYSKNGNFFSVNKSIIFSNRKRIKAIKIFQGWFTFYGTYLLGWGISSKLILNRRNIKGGNRIITA